MNFPYQVQVLVLGGKWATVGKLCDLRRANLFASGLLKDGEPAARVRCGNRIVGTYQQHNNPMGK